MKDALVIFGIIFVAAFLLLLGCTSQQGSGSSQPPQALTGGSGEQQTAQKAQDCATLDQYSQRRCFTQKAIEEDNLEYCSKIKTRDSYDNSHCYTEYGKAKKTAEPCRYVNESFYRDECFLYVAGTTEDMRICDEVESSFKRNNCFEMFAIIKEDASICDMLDLSAGMRRGKDPCIAKVAAVTRNTQLCNQLQYDDWKEMCNRDATKDLAGSYFCSPPVYISKYRQICGFGN